MYSDMSGVQCDVFLLLEVHSDKGFLRYKRRFFKFSRHIVLAWGADIPQNRCSSNQIQAGIVAGRHGCVVALAAFRGPQQHRKDQTPDYSKSNFSHSVPVCWAPLTSHDFTCSQCLVMLYAEAERRRSLHVVLEIRVDAIGCSHMEQISWISSKYSNKQTLDPLCSSAYRWNASPV